MRPITASPTPSASTATSRSGKSWPNGGVLHATFTGTCLHCHPQHKGREFNIIDWKHAGGTRPSTIPRLGSRSSTTTPKLACASCHTRRMKSGRITYLALRGIAGVATRAFTDSPRPSFAQKCDTCHPPGHVLRECCFPLGWIRTAATQGSLLTASTSSSLVPSAPPSPNGGPDPAAQMRRLPPSFPPGDRRDRQVHVLPLHRASLERGQGRPPSIRLCPSGQASDPRTVENATAKGAQITYTQGGCVTCHQHRGAHKGSLRTSLALVCHVEGGTRTRAFTHNKDTRFPLIGFHASPRCAASCVNCHQNDIYRTNKLACVDCHKDRDKHNGQLGNDCSKCHSPTQHFKDCGWSGSTASGSRGGSAQDREVRILPRQRSLQTGRSHVRNLHEKTEPHRGQLGRDCGKCHRPEKGAPKFQARHDDGLRPRRRTPRSGLLLSAIGRGLIHPCPRLEQRKKWRRRFGSPVPGHGQTLRGLPRGPASRVGRAQLRTSVTPPPVSGACSRGPREPSSRATTPKSGCVHTPICPGTKTMSGHRGARVPAATPRRLAPVVIAPTRPRVTTALWRFARSWNRRSLRSGTVPGVSPAGWVRSVSQNKRRRSLSAIRACGGYQAMARRWQT